MVQKAYSNIDFIPCTDGRGVRDTGTPSRGGTLNFTHTPYRNIFCFKILPTPFLHRHRSSKENKSEAFYELTPKKVTGLSECTKATVHRTKHHFFSQYKNYY